MARWYSGEWIWQGTCLKPTYSLRRQLLISFGITGILSISIVIGLACFVAIYAGNHAQTEARKFMRDQVILSIMNSSHYAAETFSEELDHLRGISSLVLEITRDRIAGYPRPGWEEDQYVPFRGFDDISRYPLKSPLLPRDWNITFNVHATNAEEHLHEILDMMDSQLDHDHPHSEDEKFVPHHAIAKISTMASTYFFQGNCDPKVNDPSNLRYYPNCTFANNDATTGGVVWPTSTSAGLEQRAADIGTLLKPIYESRPDILFVGVYFANEGAGSMVHYPSFVHHNRDDAYVSIGCDWLHENNNQYTNQPFFSKEITSKCHPAETLVNNREFNAMEQEWCRDQALHPNETRFYGPFVDDFFTPGGLFKVHDFDLRLWTVKVGRAIFDRYTNEFIGCVSVDVLLNRFSDLMGEGPDKSRQLIAHNFSKAVLVRKTDGQVVAGGAWKSSLTSSTIHVSETDLIPDDATFQALLTELGEAERRQEQVWKERYKLRKWEHVSSVPTAVIERNGEVLAASSLPSTDFIFIQVMENEAFEVIDDVKSDIDDDVVRLIVLSLVIGFLGILTLLLIIWSVALVLTKPLDWMRVVAWRIVNHADASVEGDSLKMHYEEHNKDFDGEVGQEKFSSTILRWTPRSEITELVQEFKNMIHGFSGRDYASTVANPVVHEIRNLIAWQSDFQNLYKKDSAEDKAKETTTLQNSLADIDNLDECKPEVKCDPLHDNNHNEFSEGVLHHGSGKTRYLRRKSNEFGNGHFGRRGNNDDPDLLAVHGRVSGRKRGSASSRHDQYSDQSSASEELNRESSASGRLFRSIITGKAPPETDLITERRQSYPETRHSEAASAALSISTDTSSSLQQQVPVELLNEGWKNQGRHIYTQHRSPNRDLGPYSREQDKVVHSQLFRWILVLIIIPMLVTNVVIVVVVSTRLTSVLPDWLVKVESASLDIARDNLSTSTKLAALYAEAVLATPVRDLFVFSRVAGWLYADAIDRNKNSFTAMDTSTEICKYYETDINSCPWFDDVFENVPCDCAWEDPPAENCFRMGNEIDSRNLQKLFWAGQRHDADPITGRRPQTSYPKWDTSPETTSWWTNMSEVPGSAQGAAATGYNTTYDRLRVFSAMSTVVFPIYNYHTSLVRQGEPRSLGTYIGFESCGVIAGWAGCSHPGTAMAFFQSSDDNLAYEANETLCPKGKYGFDPRCRSWYVAGKAKAMNMEETSLYISPPFGLVTKGRVASGATQGIFDSRSRQHVGQAVVDFTQFEMLKMGLRQDAESFYVVITPEETAAGDTVAAPDIGPDDTSGRIGDILLKHDAVDSQNRRDFNQLSLDMKNGTTNVVNFTRTREDGEEEIIWLAYDAIFVRALEPIQNDDYSRGVRHSQSLVYSIGVGQTLASVRTPFEEFREKEDAKLTRKIILYVALAVCVSLLMTTLTYQISIEVTKPMLILLRIVQNINAGRIDGDIPPLHGGAREVTQVYTSFAKLYKIVRVSNTSFFSGNLSWACHFVRDALKLFNKVGDPKAVAIASNNLGNTLLAMSCCRPKEDRTACLLINNSCVIKEAFECYETAIKNATEEFATARDLHKKAEFAEQLADRHFNRGLCLFLSRDDPCAPDDAEELGYQDLMKAQALDHDVQEFLIKNKLLLLKSGILYERLLRRIFGLVALQENGIEQTLWDPNELVYDCHRLLTAAWDDLTAPLFQDLDRYGRLQQLEGAMIKLELERDNDLAAARLAIRMLVEDEFVNERSFQYAADALLRHMASDETRVAGPSWSILSKASAQRDMRNMLKSCKHSYLNKRKCLFLCLDLGTLQQSSDDSMGMLSKHLLAWYDSTCDLDDFFGLLASNGMVGSTVNMEIECKRRRLDQRAGIETAMSSIQTASHQDPSDLRPKAKPATRTCRSFVLSADKVIGSEIISLFDSYIVLVSDGPKETWDWKQLFSLKMKIEEVNAKRKGDIHIILFDLDEDGSSEAREMCRSLCEVSRASMYIEASMNGGLEEDFQKVRSAIFSRNASSTTYNSALMVGLTMEKF